MYEFLKKGMLLGIGLASLTRERIESTVEDLIKRGEVSEKDGKTLVEELKTRSEEMRSEMTRKVEKAVRDTLDKVNIPRMTDLEDLRRRIEKLEHPEKGE